MLSIVMGNAQEDAILLVIVLDKTNHARMEKGDPAELPLKTLPLPAGLTTDKITLLVCYEEDLEQVLKLQAAPDGRTLLAHLCRGWRHQGDDGSDPIRLGRLQ